MNTALRVPWRLLSFGVAWILAQGIAESVLGPVFGLLSRRVGETVPMYPCTMLIGVAAACAVALRFVDDVPWSVMALGDGAWRLKRIGRGALLGTAAMLGTASLLWVVGALRIEAIPAGSLDGAAFMEDSWGGTALRLLWLLNLWRCWRHAADLCDMYLENTTDDSAIL